MPEGPSQPREVQRERALSLMFAERGGAVVVVAGGDTSMAPHLAGGDAVWAVPSGAPAAGDLILYRQRDYWVVHRCLGRATAKDGREGLCTRGDGRNVLDPLLSAADVVARVVAVRRGGAWRSLESAPGRIYARLMAAHDLAWAALGVASRAVGLGALVAGLDRLVLTAIVPLAFPLFHPRIAPPAASEADGPV